MQEDISTNVEVVGEQLQVAGTPLPGITCIQQGPDSYLVKGAGHSFTADQEELTNWARLFFAAQRTGTAAYPRT